MSSFEERLRGTEPVAWFYRVVGVDGEDPTGKVPGSWYLTTDPEDFKAEPQSYVFEVVPLEPRAAFVNKVARRPRSEPA